MVVTLTAMLAMLAMSAFTIDAANWYQKHHQTQLAADAAALAAASCLANAGAGQTCTSTTDTTDAAAVAATIAAGNGVTISPDQVHFNGWKITIDASSVAPSLFAEAGGVARANLTASAAAGYTSAVTTYTTITQLTPTTTTSTSTTPVTGSPLALFAMDSDCSDDGVYQQGGGDTFDGGVFSNSSLFLDTSTYESLNYGTGSGCGVTIEGGGGNYTDGPPAKAAGDLTSWPVPYDTSADPLPACTDTYTGSGTWDIGNPASETTPVVYCYPNGAILLTGWEAYDDDTFICGSFGVQGGGVGLVAEDYPANKLLIYATGTGEAVNLTNGAGVVKGDVETPNGTVGFDSGGNAFTGLLEGQEVNFSGGGSTITGDGPTTYGEETSSTATTETVTTTTTEPVTSTGPTDNLVQ